MTPEPKLWQFQNSPVVFFATDVACRAISGFRHPEYSASKLRGIARSCLKKTGL